MKNGLYLKAHTIILFIFIVLITVIFGIFLSYLDGLIQRIIYIMFMIICYLFLGSYIYKRFMHYRKQINQIQDVFDYYSTKLVGELGIGMIIFDRNKNIIWISELIEKRFGSKIIGQNIYSLYTDTDVAENNISKDTIIEKNDSYYSIKLDFEKKAIIIEDITKNYLTNRYYENAKLVLGFVDIDSYNQYQTILEEETLFKVELNVVKILDNITSKFGVVYKTYGPGKFLLITNNYAMKKMQDAEFKFVNDLRKYSKTIGVNISLSFGFGTGSDNFGEIETNARAALSQSHARGGDQITIVSSNKDNQYYGARSEALQAISRVKIKAVSNNFALSLKNTSIKQVIITGHVDADLDAIGAAYGLVAVARACKKEVYIANDTFDSTTKKAINLWMKNETTLFIKPSKAKRIVDDNTLVVVVDTTANTRIESNEAVQKAKRENIFIFDHHRLNEKPSFQYNVENAYIDTSASSTSEIITELINFMPFKTTISQECAQFLLSGIYLDTNHFQKTTSYKTFDASSWLERKGAIPQESVNILKPDENEARIILEIKRNVEEIKPGFVISIYNGELDTHVIASAANELLRTANRYASFVIAKIPGKNGYSMSARSINVNVQIISELVGGGGHFSASAATTTESLQTFKDNIIQAVISTRSNENNNN